MKYATPALWWLMSQTSCASVICTYFTVIYCVQMKIKTQLQNFAEIMDFISTLKTHK